MSGDKNPDKDRENTGTSESDSDQSDSRRNLLKALGAGSVVASSNALPDNWAKPVIDSLILPAHAQTSPPQTGTPAPTPTGTVAPTPTPVNTVAPTPTPTPIAPAPG